MFWISTAYAMGSGQQAGQDGNMLATFFPFILIFVVFYFLLIRPQQKKAKEHKRMLEALKKGDAVLTAGGMYGRILEIREDDIVVVDIGETKATFGRAYLSPAPVKQAAPTPKKELKKDKKKDKVETKEEEAEPAEPDTGLKNTAAPVTKPKRALGFGALASLAGKTDKQENKPVVE